MRIVMLVLAAALSFATPAVAEPPKAATMFKNPDCGCCEDYAKILRANGFDVTVKAVDDAHSLKRFLGVPHALESCHSLLVDGYVVEGHVPLGMVDRLLKERPAIRGIALPGMPLGSPGMDGRKTEPFVVYEISQGRPKVFAVE
jgi:hypothetical protein